MHPPRVLCLLLMMFLLHPMTYSQIEKQKPTAAPSASNFAYPQSIYVDSPNGHIWVTDFDNHRVMRFDVSTLTSVKQIKTEMYPENYSLAQNYPNPFNPGTQISFSVAKTGHVSLTVYNLLGQKVTELFNEVATANTRYLLSFNAENLSSGIYLYTLRTTAGISVKRMCLLK